MSRRLKLSVVAAAILGLAGVMHVERGWLALPADMALVPEVIGKSRMAGLPSGPSAASGGEAAQGAPGTASRPWAKNTARLLARDYHGLAQDARADPAAGSYYFGHIVAVNCIFLPAGGNLEEHLAKVRRESPADPSLLRRREEASRAMFRRCEGRTTEEWKALQEALWREGLAAGDALVTLSHTLNQEVSLANSTASVERKQELLRAALASGVPSLVGITVGAFGTGSRFEDYEIAPAAGDGLFDYNFTTAMQLMLCANFGRCGYGGYHVDDACARSVHCDETLFSVIPRELPAERWARIEGLYYRIQAALGAGDYNAFVFRLVQIKAERDGRTASLPAGKSSGAPS